MLQRVGPALLLLLVAALPSGCGSPDFSYFESITSGPNPGSTLILVWLSDGPADEAQAVEVTIERVELIGASRTVLLSAERRTVDLLTLQNGSRLQLAETEIPQGPYDRLRLTLANSAPYAPSIEVGGQVRPLEFATARANVVEVPYAFEAPADGRVEIQMDFNVRLSIEQVGESWLLLPRVDALNPQVAGAVAGRVVDAGGFPVAGATVVANQAGFEVRSTRTAPDGTYRIALLMPGSYDITLLGAFGPAQEERGVQIGLGLTTALDFRN